MLTTLFVTATVLGLLAFFEPCTIATHTLFIARLHQQPPADRFRQLLVLWLTRCFMIIGLLMVIVVITPTPQWGPWLPSVILMLMALLYLISRWTYIPIPHLALHRLLPKGNTFATGLQLGLTLPACMLPLFMIIAGLALTNDSLLDTVLAGFLFATLFTLPMIIATITGISVTGREFLQRATTAAPYLTAVLLFGAALVLILPQVDLSTDSLRTTLLQANAASIGLGFLAGFVFSFNPVSFASIPVVLAYVTKAHEQRRALVLGSAFVIGMILTHLVLGITAAASGEWVKGLLGRQWGAILGPVLIVLGLMWPGWIKFPLPWFGMRARKVTGVWGAFLLGIPFSIAVCPFCTPALLVALTASAAVGSISFGAALLLAFALGRSIPILLGAWSMGWLESLQVLSRYQRLLEITAGITLVLTGLYLLNEYFFIL
jgi:cytochrome c-type biogenesis protein